MKKSLGSPRIILSALLVLVFVLSPMGSSVAQADEEIAICAAVFPCQDDGSLMPEFNDPLSPCLDLYLSQCAAVKQESSKSDEMANLIAELEAENAKLRLKLKKTRRKLRSSQN